MYHLTIVGVSSRDAEIAKLEGEEEQCYATMGLPRFARGSPPPEGGRLTRLPHSPVQEQRSRSL